MTTTHRLFFHHRKVCRRPAERYNSEPQEVRREILYGR
jgi:hypothetical protein